MEYHTHACNASSAIGLMQSRVCLPLEPLVPACARRAAVSAARGVIPPSPARVRSTRTDSHRLAPRRGVPKGAFRGTYAPSVDMSCHAKSRLSSGCQFGAREARPTLPSSTARCDADSHSGVCGRGEPSQGGLAI